MALKLTPQQLRSIKDSPKGKLPAFLDVKLKHARKLEDGGTAYDLPNKHVYRKGVAESLKLKKDKIIGPV